MFLERRLPLLYITLRKRIRRKRPGPFPRLKTVYGNDAPVLAEPAAVALSSSTTEKGYCTAKSKSGGRQQAKPLFSDCFSFCTACFDNSYLMIKDSES